MTATELEPKLSDAPPCWPPLAHIREGNSPPKPGDRALCGERLLGIDLRGMAVREMCKKCEEIARSMGWRG